MINMLRADATALGFGLHSQSATSCILYALLVHARTRHCSNPLDIAARFGEILKVYTDEQDIRNVIKLHRKLRSSDDHHQ
jgi:hypothetical protein